MLCKPFSLPEVVMLQSATEHTTGMIGMDLIMMGAETRWRKCRLALDAYVRINGIHTSGDIGEVAVMVCLYIHDV